MASEIYARRRGPATGYAFELATAIAWLLTGITNLVSPSALAHSAVGRNVIPFAQIWSGLYILGGLAVIAGVLRPLPALRVAGLLLLGTALIMQTVAAVSFAFTPRSVSPAVYAAAAFLRAWVLIVLIRRVDNGSP